jgi:hypothetical protein
MSGFSPELFKLKTSGRFLTLPKKKVCPLFNVYTEFGYFIPELFPFAIRFVETP